MRCLPLLSALVAGVLLAACDGPAEFTEPLSAPGLAAHDERLIGSWYALEPQADGVAMLDIEAREDGLLDAAFGYMSVEAGEAGHAGIAWLRSTVHASLAGGQTYYNARVTDGGMVSKESGAPADNETDPLLAPHPDRGYWIIRASVGDDGVLMLGILSETLPRKLGLPLREIDCSPDCGFKVYGLSPAALADLISANPEPDLFAIRIPFARFGAPPPPLPE
jgi:hypothetical protein